MKKQIFLVSLMVFFFVGSMIATGQEPLWTATFDEIPGTAWIQTTRGQADIWDTGLFDAVAAPLSEPITQSDDFSWEIVFTHLGSEWSPYFNLGLFAAPGDYAQDALWVWADGAAAGNQMYLYVKESLGGAETAKQFKPAADVTAGEPRFMRYTYTAADQSVHVLFVKGTDDSATGEDVIADYTEQRVPAGAEFSLGYFGFSDSGGDPHLWNFDWNIGVDRVTVTKNGQVILNEEFNTVPDAFTVYAADGQDSISPAAQLDGFTYTMGRTYEQKASVHGVPGGALQFIAADTPADEELSYAVFGRRIDSLGREIPEGGSVAPQDGWGLSFLTAVEQTDDGATASFGLVRYGVSTVPPELVPTLNSMFLQMEATNVSSGIQLTPSLYAFNSNEEEATDTGASITVTPGAMNLVKIGLDIASGSLKAQVWTGPTESGAPAIDIAVPISADWTFNENTEVNGFGHGLAVSFGDGLITENTDFDNRAKSAWVIDDVSLYSDFPQAVAVESWELF